MPVIAVEIHTPKCIVVGGGIETMEYDPCPVRCERGIVLTNTRSGKLNQAVAIEIHDRHVGAFTGRVVLERQSGARLGTKLARQHRHLET